MKTLLTCTATALMLGLGLLGSVVRADDDAREERPRRQRLRIVDRAAGKYWIGVHAVAIDDALKSHLNLEGRLIIRAVLPDSPAAKAGLAKHDILLKFGDREVKNLEDLLKAVSANKDKAVKVVVLRGGKETALDVQPTERPDDVEAIWSEDLLLRKPLEEWLGGPAGRRFRMIGPGVFEELPALPGNLSITITKQNDEPAKITVKRDDETWEITENEIDELPEEIREHVRRRVASQRWSPNQDATTLFPLGPEGADGPLREQMERTIEQIEKLQRRLTEEDPLKALQEEMKALRREVERLRKRDQPADPPATDARDV